MIKPKALFKGANLGIVSPSYWLDAEVLQSAVKYIEDRGYQVTLAESVTSKQHIFAGSPELRARDINQMFSDPSIDAILCARGGYGANRILPLLDYDCIRANPKVFIGFSDVTGPLASMSQRAELVCFHGPMLTNFGRNPPDYNWQQMEQVLSGNSPLQILSHEQCQAYSLQTGVASGELCGGNLSLINERLGTPDQIDTRHKILFIEEVGEKLYAFDRMMYHLRNSGSLDHINGLVFGEMTEMSDTDIPLGKSLDGIIMDVCSDLDIPIISHFPAGHGDYVATLPIGHPITMIAEGTEAFLRLDESPVEL